MSAITVGKYTKHKGGHRANSCEYDEHGWRCEHGDCFCPCHDVEPIACQICRERESTEQLSNETCYVVCYGCRITQMDAIPEIIRVDGY